MVNDDITSCFTAAGPVITAYLPTPSQEPQAATAAARRWKSMRQELRQAGADDATLEAIDEAVGVDTDAVDTLPTSPPENSPGTAPADDRADHRQGEVLAIVASAGEVLLRRPTPDTPAAGRWRLGALPWVAPLFALDQAAVPHVVVLIDRRGADIWGLVSGTGTVSDVEVQGREQQVTRSAPGGWSQRRFQQRAVNAWESNAGEVAEEVAEVTRSLAARRVLVGGDEQSISFLLDALPADVAALVRRLPGGARGPESGLDGVADDVGRLVRTVVAEDTVAIVDAFREERGQQDRAADGPADVVKALQMAMVETLLVHDDPDDERTAWFGPDHMHIALDPAELHAMGCASPERAQLVDVLVRAARGSGADVRIVPAGVTREGVGALLRAPRPA